MKRATLLSLMVMLSLSLPALAHDAKKAGAKGKNVTLTGCLSEHGGGYMLTNKEHPDGVMLTTTEDLKAHVGHKVRVSGTLETGEPAGDTKASTSTGAASANMPDMHVTTFKHVSEKCDMSGAPPKS